MTHDEIETLWDLLTYIGEHRASIFVRVNGQNVALSQMEVPWLVGHLTHLMANWVFDGIVPIRVVAEPDSPKSGDTIHRLYQGAVACGEVNRELRKVPGDWPEGHKWSTAWSDVTCLACLLNAPGADE
jgi:hypothetical protein